MTARPEAVLLARDGRASPGSFARLALVPLWTLAALAAAILLSVGPGGVGRRRRVVRGWARVLLRLLRIEVTRDGTPPSPPFLLVANHLSYLDVIVLASQTDTVFVAKREVRRWPVFGVAAAFIGCIFVDRDSRSDAVRVGEAMRRRYRSGAGVVLFAEGTSSDGSTVLSLRSALLEWPAGERVPVHTATLSYHTGPGDPPASLALCWWGDMTFLPHLTAVCRLGPSRARVVFGSAPVSAGDRKSLARALHAALLADFRPSNAR